MTAKVNKTDSDCGVVSLRTSAVSGVYASIVFALKHNFCMHFLSKVPHSSIKRGFWPFGELMPEAPTYTSWVVSQTGFHVVGNF